MRLALSRVHYPVRALGPGVRIGIWFQGCSIRCRGCISSDTWAHNRGLITLDALFATILPWLSQADGVTISGGEPFDQPQALRELLVRIRDNSFGDILVYSGYSLESLSDRLVEFRGLIDALISDPFETGTPQTLPLRGSDNQRLTILTPLGEQRFRAYSRPVEVSANHVDTMFDDRTGEVWVAGILRQGDLRRLASLLALSGHRMITTEDQR